MFRFIKKPLILKQRCLFNEVFTTPYCDCIDGETEKLINTVCWLSHIVRNFFLLRVETLEQLAQTLSVYLNWYVQIVLLRSATEIRRKERTNERGLF